MTAPAFQLAMQSIKVAKLDPLAGPAPTAYPPRYYQREAADAAVAWHSAHEGHCLIVVPTGGGKSLIIAMLASEAVQVHARVLVIAHRKELIDQNVRAVRTLTMTSMIGIVSAQLGRKDATKPITVGSIQTLARAPYQYGPYDLILCDECHLLPRSDDTQYRKFLDAQHAQNPNVRIIGLSATPYRLDSGRLDQGENRLFTDIAYECDLPRLIREGYLSPIISKATLSQYDTTGVQLSGGEFAPGALERRINTPEATQGVVEELVRCAGDRKKWLVFAAGIAHAERLAEGLNAAGISTGVVHGNLSAGERAEALYKFKTGQYRALCNCDLLTTGFDEPAIDLVALCRPTKSASLFVQMVGRGLRIADGKTNCLILDFSGNTIYHGPIDAIVIKDRTKSNQIGEAPAKSCPTCLEIVATGTRICPSCSYNFPPPQAQLIATRAHNAPVISTEQTPALRHEVHRVEYHYHENRKEPTKPPTLRVEYFGAFRKIASEWVCLEHSGFAKERADQWWKRRVTPEMAMEEWALPPRTILDAMEHADELAKPLAIHVKRDGAYDRIADYEWPIKSVVQDPAAANGLPRACWNCQHWNDTQKLCLRWNEAPPDAVQATGCEDFSDTDDPPF